MVAMHPSCVLDHKPNWIFYNEYVLTKKNYVRNITEIKVDYLFDKNVCGDYFETSKINNIDIKRELIAAE